MATATPEALHDLYLADETAWLDIMAGLAREGRAGELDLANLAEFLEDMSRRERREVESRLTVLLLHLLKWEHQPDRRSRSWRASFIEQRQELEIQADGGVLRKHAEECLPKVYPKAVERAEAETNLPIDRFPATCPYTLAELLAIELPRVED